MSNHVSELPASEHIHNLLRKEHGRVNIGVPYKFRLAIILNGISGMSNYRCLRELHTTERTVTKWRNRWKESYDILETMVTQGVSGNGVTAKDHEIVKQIKAILADHPMSGTPKRITMSQEQQIVALATRKPEDHGIPMTNWTHEMLAHVAKAEGIVESISGRYVGIILKKTN